MKKYLIVGFDGYSYLTDELPEDLDVYVEFASVFDLESGTSYFDGEWNEIPWG